jgi:hypothetical protein
MRMQVKWLIGSVAAAMLAGGGSVGWALAQEGGKDSQAEVLAAQRAPSAMTDIRGHWAEEAIKLAVGKGYVEGYEDGSFRPDQSVTRAEFAKLVLTALHTPVSGVSEGSSWYLPYVNAAVNAGIHQWSDFNNGDWNTPMTRMEMARMASRAAGQSTEDEKQWMYLATKAGLIQGTDDTGSLDVEGTTTRAQSVTIIERILNVKSGHKLETDKHAVSRAEVLWHKTNIETMLDGDYIDVAATPVKDRFNPDKLYCEHDNGNVRGWSDGLFVIDLDDPNDPYKHLLLNAKIFIIDENDVTTYHPIPKGGYALISVNNVEVLANPNNLTRFYNSSYLGFDTSFNYGQPKGTVISSEGNLLFAKNIVFYTSDNKVELAQGGPVLLNQIYTSRFGMIFPKIPGTSNARGGKFTITFKSFGDFGDGFHNDFSYFLNKGRIEK